MTANRKHLLFASFCAAGFLSLTAAVNVPVRESADAFEVARLRAHFAVVLGELRSAPVAHLSPSQIAARTELISRLERYAAAGRFPHNHVVPAKRVPVFRDEHRTLCAMGYLI